MGIQVFCPKCDRSCRIKAEYLGRRVRCPDCQEIFKAEEVPVADMDDESSTRRDDEAPEIDQPSAALRRPKATPLVEPGKLHNPFEGSATLSAVQTDLSVFDFDIDEAEPASGKKRTADRSRSTDDDRPRPRSRKQDRQAPDTQYAWDPAPAPPGELPADDSDAGRKRKTPAIDSAPSAGSPFAFDTTAGDAREDKPRSSRRDHEDTPRPSRAAKAHVPRTIATSDADAAFLGLVDQDDAPAAPAPKPSKQRPARAFFHLRQSGFWGDTYLFRVFVCENELAFVTAAAGADIDDMEGALEADNLDDFDKRVRNKVRDLNELPVDELIETHRHSFRWSAGKIVQASIDAPPLGARHSKDSRSVPAVLHFVHKSKGSIAFEFPANIDVKRAADCLRECLGHLEVHVRWDKASKRFVKR
jgi:hypothetical protein